MPGVGREQRLIPWAQGVVDRRLAQDSIVASTRSHPQQRRIAVQQEHHGMSLYLRSFVRGKQWPRAGGPTQQLWDAATGLLRGEFEVAPPEAVEDALSAAHEAQAAWSHGFSPAARSRLLLEAARLVREDSENIAALETADTGRPIVETSIEGPGAADCLEWFAGLGQSVGGQHLELPSSASAASAASLGAHSFGYTRREALGTTVGIGAWNYPLQSAVWKSAPALAFGNTMVFKPSELTPQTALRLAEIYQRAGIPEGVFGVVLGDGTVGQTLVEDPRVAKVSFTGSVPTGRRIYERAAKDFKKVTLELGGKSPLLIFEDADLDAAVGAAMMANWYSSGQVCSNGTRVFVHRSLLERFLEQLVERTQRLVIGDPMDPKTQIGPMVSEAHLKKVEEYIRVGVEEDQARLVCGGDRIQDLPGYYLTPAIFTDCDDSMRIVREEIFGMVMAILPFDDEQEVVERANHTNFGLSAGVFTQNLKRAHRVVARLEAGTTWINNYNLAPVELPWGGWKHSGLGSENGLAGVDSWTRIKSVYVELNDAEYPYS